MGYAGFSLKEISRGLLPSRQNRGNGSPGFCPAVRDDCSWANLNSISDFLQDITTRRRTPLGDRLVDKPTGNPDISRH
jgi:hypothetical protein